MDFARKNCGVATIERLISWCRFAIVTGHYEFASSVALRIGPDPEHGGSAEAGKLHRGNSSAQVNYMLAA
jgi:hypothetical protein